MEEGLREIVLGAMLHDIGKVVQRARTEQEARRRRHQEFGAEWFDGLPVEVRAYLGEGCRDFILRHHSLRENDPKYERLDVFAPGYRGDLAIVWEADNLAAGERREDPEEEHPAFRFDRHLPLISIFDRLRGGPAVSAPRAHEAVDLLGEGLHVGKGTTFGLGWYRMEVTG